MLRRSVDLAGGWGGTAVAGAGAGSIGDGGGDSGASSGTEVVTHADKCSATTASPRRAPLTRLLVTQTNPEYVDLRCAQTAPQHVQFIEVVSRANVHAMIIPVVDLYALYVRFNAV